MDAEDISVIEKFTVLAYDRSSPYTTVDAARRTLFTQKNRAYDVIPPTQATLLQHVLRATYHSGYIWSQSLVPDAFLPSPINWGWKEGADGIWTVH